MYGLVIIRYRKPLEEVLMRIDSRSPDGTGQHSRKRSRPSIRTRAI